MGKALREKKAKERKIKKQGREKARKNGRGNEKTKKAAHREALRKKSGAEGKIKEKKGKETTVKENRAKEKSIKHRKKHLTKEQAKNQRSSGSSEKRCTSIASVPRERLLKNANSRRRPIMPRGPMPGPLGMPDNSRRKLRSTSLKRPRPR